MPRLPNIKHWRLELLWEEKPPDQGVPWSGGFKSVPFLEYPKWEKTKAPVFYEYYGIESFWTYSPEKKPVYIVDNHHKVLLGMYEQWKQQNTPLTVVHIDAHRDNAIFEYEINEKSIEEVVKACRVCDYLDAGKKMGIIETVISVTQTWEAEQFAIPKSPFVLNLDIDIFSEEGSHMDLALKTKTIALAWTHASAVYIATSPGFIDGEEACQNIEILLQKRESQEGSIGISKEK